MAVKKEKPSTESKLVGKYAPGFLLKDQDGKEYMGISRESFLIGKDGKIIKRYQKVNPANHPEEVLKDAKSLK